MGKGGKQLNQGKESTEAIKSVSLEELSSHRTPEDGKPSLFL